MDIPIENLFSVNVTRIVSPEIKTDSFITAEESSQYFTPENSLEAVQLDEEYRTKWRPLPKRHEGIYLGETVTFYIRCTNDSTQDPMTSVNVAIDLQIGKNVNRLKVLATESLDAKGSITEILNFEVKDLNPHNLILTISFGFPNVETQTIRKYIQYPVSKPIDVKTKCYVNTEYEEVYLEALFQNLSQLPIQLTKVNLESQYFDVNSSHNFMSMNDGDNGVMRDSCDKRPNSDYDEKRDNKELEKRMNGLSLKDGEKRWIFGEINRLNPSETRQYFFILKLRNDAPKPATKLGKLDIFWHSGVGVKGHIQTSQLDNSHRFVGPLKIIIDSIPDKIHCREIFSMKFRLINSGESPIQPTLHFINSKEQKVLWLGLANKTFPELAPSESVQIDKKLFPTETGLYSIPLIKVHDLISQEGYDHKELGFVNIV